jgi:hypothetical protein
VYYYNSGKEIKAKEKIQIFHHRVALFNIIKKFDLYLEKYLTTKVNSMDDELF